MGGLIVGRLRGVDIRGVGSGNVGGTNALRTQGKMFAFWVVLIDVIKGVIAAGCLTATAYTRCRYRSAGAPRLARGGVRSRRCVRARLSGLVRISWWQRRCDTGRNPAWDTAGLVDSGPGDVAGGRDAVGICGSRDDVRERIAADLSVCDTGAAAPALTTFSMVMAVFVIYTHRSNVARMLRHSEPRAQRLWLLRR